MNKKLKDRPLLIGGNLRRGVVEGVSVVYF